MQEKVIARESSSYEAHSCEMKVYSSAKNVVAKRKRKQSKSERDSTRRQQQKIRVTMFVRALALATVFWTLESAIKHTAPWFDCHRNFKGHMAGSNKWRSFLGFLRVEFGVSFFTFLLLEPWIKYRSICFI